MEYVYPAIFYANDDGSYTITYPDLPGCISEGKSLVSALAMAHSALAEWIEYHTDKQIPLPDASPLHGVAVGANEFVNLTRVEIKDGRSVKRTVSLPKWQAEKADRAGLSLSRVLQDALIERLVR